MSRVTQSTERRPHSNTASTLSRQFEVKHVPKVTVVQVQANFAFKKIDPKSLTAGANTHKKKPSLSKRSFALNSSRDAHSGTRHNHSQMVSNANNTLFQSISSPKHTNTPVLNESNSEKRLKNSINKNSAILKSNTGNVSTRANISKGLAKTKLSNTDASPKYKSIKSNNQIELNSQPLNNTKRSFTFPKSSRENLNVTSIKKTKMNDSNISVGNIDGASHGVSANKTFQLAKGSTTNQSRNLTPNKTFYRTSKEKDKTTDHKVVTIKSYRSTSKTGESKSRSPIKNIVKTQSPLQQAASKQFPQAKNTKGAHPVLFNAYVKKVQTAKPNVNTGTKGKAQHNTAVITGVLSNSTQGESPSNAISTNSTYISKVENKDGYSPISKIKPDPIIECEIPVIDQETIQEPPNCFLPQHPSKCIIPEKDDSSNPRRNLLKEKERVDVDFRKIETSPLIRKKPQESNEEKNYEKMPSKSKINQMVNTSFGDSNIRTCSQELPKPQKIEKKIKLMHEFTKIGFAGPGMKKINQDIYFVFTNFAGTSTDVFMAVCDGHGLSGHEISGFLKENLPFDLNRALKSQNKNKTIHEIIECVFLETNYKLCCHDMIDSTFSGSTCVSLIYTPEKLICANVGDSRAVLGKCVNGEWKSHDLSRDHKPSESDEAERVIQKGGRIQPFKDEDEEFVGPPRVWLKDEEIPGLAMSRSFGDRVAATVGVISKPGIYEYSDIEITEYQFTEEDKFFIVASDGVWEFIDSQECINIIKDYYLTNDIAGCCEYLHQEAAIRWMKEEEVIDDITMIVVFLE